MSRGTEDPCRLALAHAQGALADAARLLKRCPDTDGMVDRLRQLGKELGARLDGMPLQTPLQLLPRREEAKAMPGQAEELQWREDEVVRVHLLAFRQWRAKSSGVSSKNGHDLPAAIRKTIRAAILEYDKGLLRLGDRERWSKESRVRAAGIGIFYSPWHTGDFPESEGKPPHWSGPYVEHDRPWTRQRGKPDPILKFSEYYFEAAGLAEEG